MAVRSCSSDRVETTSETSGSRSSPERPTISTGISARDSASKTSAACLLSRVSTPISRHGGSLIARWVASINGTGNAADNVIIGNDGDNILTGKAGVGHADRRARHRHFVFATGDTGAALGQRDLITDFTVGTDKLDLSTIDANTLLNGAQDFRFLGTSAFDGQGGALRYSYDAGRNVTVLEADTNGDRTADLAIDLTGNKTLTDTDFAAGSLAAGASGPFAAFGLDFNQISLMGAATLAAFAGAPIPAGWSVVTPAQLGLAAQYQDGNYFTNPATDANAIVLAPGQRLHHFVPRHRQCDRRRQLSRTLFRLLHRLFLAAPQRDRIHARRPARRSPLRAAALAAAPPI